jgi:hypothetical protein
LHNDVLQVEVVALLLAPFDSDSALIVLQELAPDLEVLLLILEAEGQRDQDFLLVQHFELVAFGLAVSKGALDHALLLGHVGLQKLLQPGYDKSGVLFYERKLSVRLGKVLH